MDRLALFLGVLHSRERSGFRFLNVEFHRFLMWLSERPRIIVAIFTHWFPYWSCSWVKGASSSGVQGSLLSRGSR
jgi:hypothetical protein